MAIAGCLCPFEKGREEESGEIVMPEDVGSELEVISVFCELVDGGVHDASVVEKDV